VTSLAGQRSADLIVLGRRPRTREHRLLLGETADAVVRRSDTPVLFVPPETHALGRVLVALDGGDRSVRVLEVAAAFARFVAAGSLEAVIVEPDRDDEAVADSPVPLSGRSLRLEAILSQFARDHPDLPPVPLAVRRGHVIDEILAEVEAARPDVLVIGYRRGGPPKVVGPRDIARNLLYAVPTAVLTVPL
jgi:nucleotide-binding universal stress UspA family protein